MLAKSHWNTGLLDVEVKSEGLEQRYWKIGPLAGARFIIDMPVAFSRRQRYFVALNSQLPPGGGPPFRHGSCIGATRWNKQTSDKGMFTIGPVI